MGARSLCARVLVAAAAGGDAARLDPALGRGLSGGRVATAPVGTIFEERAAGAGGQDGGELFRTFAAPPSTARPLTAAENAAIARSRLKPRRDVHRDGDWHRCVDVWIYEGSTLLLQRRSALKDTNPGKLDVACAGHVSGDDGARDTALKELAEELGLRRPALDGLVHAFAGANPSSGATAAHGPYDDFEICDVFVLPWGPDAADAFGSPGAALADAVFRVGAGEVGELVLVDADDALARIAAGDAEFVPRAPFYVDAVRAAIGRKA